MVNIFGVFVGITATWSKQFKGFYAFMVDKW